MRVLVTGGAGYIGSHTVVRLMKAGYMVTILDDFSNAERDVPDRIAEIAEVSPDVVEADVTEPRQYRSALERAAPDATIHFAGLKAVGEAMSDPLAYYRVNLGGSLALFSILDQIGCRRLIFSSSATVYGAPDRLPIPEEHPLRPANPYGATKAMTERLITDWAAATPELSAVSLRYFNPIGAHPSGRIGEAPSGTPNNLMPFIAEVAIGRRGRLRVFGNDWDTPDGTGVRDYIHVEDLAEAHLAALDLTGRQTGTRALNIGTGRGYSVLELIRAFENASGRRVPFDIAPRRPGDVASLVADPASARACLGWNATRGLDDMCRDTWNWKKRSNAA